MDCSLPGFSVPGILQARTLEWVAISFSNAWKWKVKVKLLNGITRHFQISLSNNSFVISLKTLYCFGILKSRILSNQTLFKQWILQLLLFLIATFYSWEGIEGLGRWVVKLFSPVILRFCRGALKQAPWTERLTRGMSGFTVAPTPALKAAGADPCWFLHIFGSGLRFH